MDSIHIIRRHDILAELCLQYLWIFGLIEITNRDFLRHSDPKLAPKFIIRRMQNLLVLNARNEGMIHNHTSN